MAQKRRKNWCAGEVSTHSDATQANPTFSREDLGAVLSNAKIGRILKTTKVSLELIGVRILKCFLY